MYIDTSSFAKVLDVSERQARSICASKGAWRGNDLRIIQTECQGGAGGRQYLVALSSLPAEMQERAKTLDLPLREPFDRLSHGEIAEWQREEAKFRLHVITPAINTTPRSKERAQALNQIAKCTHRDRNGAAKTVSERTARIWLDAYEEKGLSGLVPKASPVRGVRRVQISRRWDAEIDLDNTVRATVASELEQYARDGTAAGWSTRTVARQCGQKLAELSKQHGSQLSRQKLTAICALTKKWASRFDEFRRVDRFRHDNKAWDDRDKPRILRKLSDKPMDVVFGDVHPIDIDKRLPDNPNRQMRLRLIAWMDDATRFIWGKLAAFGPGTGVRKTDIADSLYDLVVSEQGGGLPVTFYLDNGGEYNDVAKAIADFPELSGLIAGRGHIRAQPYNGAAKPIEGIFRILEQNYFRFLPGWIGGDRSNKKTQQVGKPVQPFPGTLEELAMQIQKAIATYNDTPQENGKLEGRSPREAFEAAIANGWEPQRTDARSFDEIFGERHTRLVKQGHIEFRNARYTSELIGKLGYRAPVEVRAPLRSGVDHVFIRRNGIPCGEAHPEQAYDPQDRRGAEEAGRRIKEHKGAIRELEAQLTPGFDGFAELTRNTTILNLGQEQPGIIMRLAGEEPEARIAREAQQQDARAKKFHEIAKQFNGTGRVNERKASGGTR
ncbi:hypothetical protein [Maritimibacter sp. HL-12]|uniref:hypothetical protein n=1 Tax=Maritimibacter sp. HL-12 TaxID=1162418 RepID=UPI00111C4529|nr:hypothetical protein [Maritimibacter sp. HL-12]